MSLYVRIVAFYFLLAAGISSGTCACAAELLQPEASFAEEYQELADLLSRVNDGQTAIQYRNQIAQQISYLKGRQQSGEEAFQLLSPDEKRQFISRFQQNQFHCGVITQVHQEARRILLNPAASDELRDLITQIP